jgi:hypothetical protein
MKAVNKSTYSKRVPHAFVVALGFEHRASLLLGRFSYHLSHSASSCAFLDPSMPVHAQATNNLLSVILVLEFYISITIHYVLFVCVCGGGSYFIISLNTIHVDMYQLFLFIAE